MKNVKEGFKLKSLGKQTTPPKVGILFLNIISKFSKTKNWTKKNTSLNLINSKKFLRRLQIKKLKKTDPPKVGILILNTISKLKKKQINRIVFNIWENNTAFCLLCAQTHSVPRLSWIEDSYLVIGHSRFSLVFAVVVTD